MISVKENLQFEVPGLKLEKAAEKATKAWYINNCNMRLFET